MASRALVEQIRDKVVAVVGGSKVAQVLAKLGHEQYLDTLLAHRIDFEAIPLLEPADLVALGISVCARACVCKCAYKHVCDVHVSIGVCVCVRRRGCAASNKTPFRCSRWRISSFSVG